jgi:poly-gamma-glutamate synthesis protein (capsule biosynthesis protein)
VLGAFVSFVFAPTREYKIEEIRKDVLDIVFVGDMMFDRYVRIKAETNGYGAIFEDVEDAFTDSDLLVGNLEGPITTFTPVSKPNGSGIDHYRFTFATTVAKTLKDVGFSTVFLANNHIQNFGAEGITQTKENLKTWDVDYFGAPDEPYEPYRFASGSQQIVMYAFDTWHSRDVSILQNKIKDEKEDTFVIVYTHWGDEYVTVPNKGQIEIAHTFVDAGADFVVGSHPHVVQSKEFYKDKWIYYSLGNFVFDQYFNKNVICGAMTRITIEEDNSYTVSETFTELHRDGTTRKSTCLTEVPLVVGNSQ